MQCCAVRSHTLGARQMLNSGRSGKCAFKSQCHKRKFQSGTAEYAPALVSCRSDKTYAIEPLSTGLFVRENPAEVLTNSPALDAQIKNLGKYAGISPQKGRKSLLPGDYSSESRFIRAFFVKENSLCDESETEGITQFFHILSAVEQPKGSVLLKTGEVEHTLYSSCEFLFAVYNTHINTPLLYVMYSVFAIITYYNQNFNLFY